MLKSSQVARLFGFCRVEPKVCVVVYIRGFPVVITTQMLTVPTVQYLLHIQEENPHLDNTNVIISHLKRFGYRMLSSLIMHTSRTCFIKREHLVLERNCGIEEIFKDIKHGFCFKTI